MKGGALKAGGVIQALNELMTALLRPALPLLCVLLLSPVASAAPGANEAKNIARLNCGARLEWTLPDGTSSRQTPVLQKGTLASPAVLIMDDDTVSCPLKAGDSIFVVSLPRTTALDRFTFLNENAEASGELRIAVADENLPVASEKWKVVQGNLPFAHKRFFNLSLLGVEAKYVRLTFHVEEQGRIAAFGLYGAQKISAFAANDAEFLRVANTTALPTGRPADTLNFDFGNLYARARVVYVSSGPQELSPRMIDDDSQTAFAFAPGDPHPTVIIELFEAERLNRVSALYKATASHLEVYLLDQLRTDPGDLSGLKPWTTVTEGSGKAAVDFEAHGARYVAFRWQPRETRNFEVAEVHAFGHVPLQLIAAATVAPDLYTANDGIDAMLGFFHIASSQDFNTFEIPQVPVPSK